LEQALRAPTARQPLLPKQATFTAQLERTLECEFLAYRGTAPPFSRGTERSIRSLADGKSIRQVMTINL